MNETVPQARIIAAALAYVEAKRAMMRAFGKPALAARIEVWRKAEAELESAVKDAVKDPEKTDD